MKTSIRSRLLLRGILTHLPSIGVVVCLTLGAATPTRAQVIVADYSFSGGSLESSSSDTNSTASNITIGPGLPAGDNFGIIFGSTYYYEVKSDDLPTTESSAVSGSDYITFTVTPLNSESLDYTNLFFDIVASVNNITPPFVGDISVRSSVDGFASDIITSGSISQDSGEGEEGVSGAISLPAQSGPVSFNFYFFDNQSSSSSYVGITDIQLTATETPVPEPSTWADMVLSAGLLLLAAHARRYAKPPGWASAAAIDSRSREPS